jgi:DNA-binding NarL/FixJ family response regulator
MPKKDTLNKINNILNERIETFKKSLIDSDDHVIIRNITEKNIEQYELLKIIMSLKLNVEEVLPNEQENIVTSLGNLKLQFLAISVDILELIEKGVQNNEISENYYINLSNITMNDNKILSEICDINM